MELHSLALLNLGESLYLYIIYTLYLASPFLILKFYNCNRPMQYNALVSLSLSDAKRNNEQFQACCFRQD